MNENSVLCGERFRVVPTIYDESFRLKLMDLCRLCGKEDGSLISIFEAEGKDTELKSMIERYLPLQILDNDELPRQVCRRCASTLWKWHELKISCLEVNDILVKYVREAKMRFIDQCNEFDSGDDSGRGESLQEPVANTLTSESRSRSSVNSVAECQQEHLSEYSVADSAFSCHELGPGSIDSSNVQVTWDHNYVLREDCVGPVIPRKQPLLGLTYRLRVTPCPGNRTLVTVRWRWRQVSCQPAAFCNVCKQTFGTEGVLVTHTRFHVGSTPFYCKHCGSSFRLLGPLQQHLRAGCPLQQESEAEVTAAHPLTRAEADSHFPCSLCPRRYKLKASFKEHLRQHLGKAQGKLRCNVCSHKFFRKAALLKHMQGHLEESSGRTGPRASPLVQCHACDKLFLTERDLRIHKISHSDARPFICSTCGLTYKRKSHLTRHIALIHVEGSGQRATAARRQRRPRLHLALGEKGAEPRHTCPECGRSFRQSGALSRHVRIVHGGARDYACSVCGHTFTAKATLDSHMRIHSGEKPFACAQCPKMFRTMQQRRLHETTHTDARPFPCQFCSKRFRRRPHLTVHIRTHTGERPFACPLCSRGFTQKNDMIKHLSVHARRVPVTDELSVPVSACVPAPAHAIAPSVTTALTSDLGPTSDLMPALSPALTSTTVPTLSSTPIPTFALASLSPTPSSAIFRSSGLVPCPLPATEDNNTHRPLPIVIDVATSGPEAFTDEPASFVFFNL